VNTPALGGEARVAPLRDGEEQSYQPFVAEPTIVSLTFDDATSDQYVLRSLLTEYSMRATFYVNSGTIGGPGFMTWAQLSALAGDGHEIGGHTRDHVELTRVGLREALRQILLDRRALTERGFRITSFAYPYGDYNASVARMVRTCGYTSARRSWGLRPIGVTARESVVPVLESTPPANSWATRTVQSIRTWHSFAEIATTVARAEASGGGWVTLVFHRVSEFADRDGYSVAPETFEALLRWLDGRTAYGTYVRTVQEVVAPSPVGRPLQQLPPQRSRAGVA
jgi:peptidoglycan/xylan/chitin deacetylase (PgdA/CDA1 family)